jgi:pimeloyl-ACP methyl ester carboxylesterase
MECRLPAITIHYETFGEGRPMVVLPGWPDDAQVPADYLEPCFADRPGWRRIYLDLPGRGRTRGEPWITTNDQVLDIVLQVLDRLIPGQGFALAGHSAGAYLARAVLRDRPTAVDGLLQVVPVVDPDGDDPVPVPVTLLADEELMTRVAAELGPDIATGFGRSMVVQRPDIYERFKALLPGIEAGDAQFLDRLDQSLSMQVDPQPAPYPRPTLFVLGRQDAVVGYRSALAIVEDYPRATVAVLDRAGHILPWEQPALFAALVSDWLDRIEAEVPAARGSITV